MRDRLGKLYDLHGEKLRFLLVGVWNTLFSVGLLWVLERFIPHDSRSIVQKELVLALNWVLSVTQNFFSFKLLVFRTKGHWLSEYVKMYLTYAVTFVVQSVLVLAISEVFRLSLFWSNIPTVFVVMILSYLGHKYFTFSRPDHAFEEGASEPAEDLG